MLRILPILTWFLIGTAPAQSVTTQAEVDRILAMRVPPFGVVFEIVESRADALSWAVPEVNRQIQRLRAKFPQIGIAVVTHGREQFALLTSERGKYQAVHETIEALVKSDVPVHVCATHAGWRGKTEADFPDYVDVTPAGPTEIRNYQAMGYELIIVRKP